VYAVLIGIDGYSLGSQLSGCVSDAKAMMEYLMSTLHIPEGNIQCLLHSRDVASVKDDPTRQNIIDNLRALSKKQRVQYIIIYFAGHGSIYLNSDYCEDGIESYGSSHALCPADRGETS
ncbi:uncharacterized protein EV420DRAFT_1270521, partial [Desarmillaria tabescens]